MRFKTKQNRILIVIVIVIVIGLFSFFRWQNNAITISKITMENENLPKTFNGYKILQISDLHNKEFGANQNKLLAQIEKLNPDIIVVTGDLIDSKKINLHVAMDLIHGAMEIAPLFYVSGNHEAWSGSYGDLKSRLENSKVIVLDNQKIEVFKNNESIEILGMSDPSFMESDLQEYAGNALIEDLLRTLTVDNNKFKILLSHRPELFDLYSKSNIDLVFSGHAHGGQFRLPFIGGLIAPNQGFFPKLTEGIHTRNNTSMVISRGLGNSIIPIRIFNRPELIMVTLSTP